MSRRRTRNEAKLLGEARIDDNLDNPLFTALSNLEAENRKKRKGMKAQKQATIPDGDEGWQDIEDFPTEVEGQAAASTPRPTAPIEPRQPSPPRRTAAEKQKGPATTRLNDQRREQLTPTPNDRQEALREAVGEYRGNVTPHGLFGRGLPQSPAQPEGDTEADNAKGGDEARRVKMLRRHSFNKTGRYDEVIRRGAETVADDVGISYEDAEPVMIEAMRRVIDIRAATGKEPDQPRIMLDVLVERGLVDEAVRQNVPKGVDLSVEHFRQPQLAEESTKHELKPRGDVVSDAADAKNEVDAQKKKGKEKETVATPDSDEERAKRKRRKGKRTKKKRSRSSDSESGDTGSSSDDSSDAPTRKKRARVLGDEPEPEDDEMNYRPEEGRYKVAKDVVENLRGGLAKRALYSFDFTDAKILKSLDETRGKVAQDVYFADGKWKKAKEQRLLTMELSAAEFSEVMRRAARTVGKEFAPGGDSRRRGGKVAAKLRDHLDSLADILTEKVRPYSGGCSPAKLLAAKTIYDELFTDMFDHIREQRKDDTPVDKYRVLNIARWDNSRWLEAVSYAEDDLRNAQRGGSHSQPPHAPKDLWFSIPR